MGTLEQQEGRREIILQSRMRSESYGLREHYAPDFSRIPRNNLQLVLDQSQVLHTHALPIMTMLHDQIVNTHSVVLLTDPEGTIVHSVGDPSIMERVARVALTPGVNWSEESKGTNAIGTAIVEDRATTVHGDEHFLSANRFLTCSASPIHDPMGKLIGILDVTGDRGSFHGHTMALVRLSAEMIEDQVFRSLLQEQPVVLYFHSRPEFINTMMEGIISFDATGRVVMTNRKAISLLGGDFASIRNHTFTSLFGLSLASLYDHYRGINPQLLMLHLGNGLQVFAQARINPNNRDFQLGTPTARPAGSPSARSGSACKSPWAHLEQLDTGHPQMRDNIHKIRKVLNRDIPILILGETGTGKEILARAIHNDSARSDKPFIAVNCASIPESLIESELFGYEDGAFTGARKKGSMGKFLQAHTGTIFLDEIGDMPLGLQARLLRVLQERSVTPLGSNKLFPVDVMVICATHQNLRERMLSKTFREDLYYRLYGLVVKLPALRERSDLEIIVNKILQVECRQCPVKLSPEVREIFLGHDWPGNIRQMTNVIRTSVVMVDSDGILRKEHLPADFLDEFTFKPDRSHTSDTASSQPEPGALSSSPYSTALPAPQGVASPIPLNMDARSMDHIESEVIRQTIEKLGGNVSAAARQLGISRNTIYRKLQHAD